MTHEQHALLLPMQIVQVALAGMAAVAIVAVLLLFVFAAGTLLPEPRRTSRARVSHVDQGDEADPCATDDLTDVADATREPALEPLTAYEAEVADLDRLVRRLARNGGVL